MFNQLWQHDYTFFQKLFVCQSSQFKLGIWIKEFFFFKWKVNLFHQFFLFSKSNEKFRSLRVFLLALIYQCGYQERVVKFLWKSGDNMFINCQEDIASTKTFHLIHYTHAYNIFTINLMGWSLSNFCEHRHYKFWSEACQDFGILRIHAISNQMSEVFGVPQIL